jgi:hypothetical protein
MGRAELVATRRRTGAYDNRCFAPVLDLLKIASSANRSRHWFFLL